MQKQLEELQNERASGSSQEPFSKAKGTPKSLPADKEITKVPNQSANPVSAATKKGRVPPTSSNPVPETQAAKDARLRRICERKPSGRLGVTEEIHNKWKYGSRAERDELLETLEACNYDKD